MKAQPFLLAGKWMSEGPADEIRSPYDGAVAGVVHRAAGIHLAQAIEAAAQAFQITRKLAGYERQRILTHISRAIAAQADEFVRTIALEAGKPVKAARAEVERAVFTFQTAAKEATRINGEWMPLDALPSSKGRAAVIRRFPIGPIAAITPFNFPLNLVAHKLAPAIAAGSPVVLKPAPQTPLTAMRLAQLILDAGWPGKALSVLPLSNEDAAALVTDDRLKLLSFTGSAKVGWELKARAGKKRVTLELGGNAGVIVHHDAGIRTAAQRCAVGGFTYAGQSCISVQRILVHERVFDEFTQLLLDGVRALKVGNPLDEQTDVGPLIREPDVQRVKTWIGEAIAAGATLLTGGGVKGTILEPAVLTGTSQSMRVNCEEIFAPVVTVEPYADFSNALARTNATPYGLQSGVFTYDMRLILRAFEELEVGGVIVNDVPTFRSDQMPYGGVKDSGLGREGLRYAIEDMTELRTLVLNLNS